MFAVALRTHSPLAPLSPEAVTRRLRSSLLILMLAVATAFLLAGCAWPPVLFGSAAVAALAFAPWLKAVTGRIHYSLGAAVSGILVATLLLGAVGCSASQQQKVKDVVAMIAIEIPKGLPLATTVAGLAEQVFPAEAPLVSTFTETAVGALTELAALCDSYAKAPTADIWDSIVAAVNKLEADGSAALLDAAHITNPVSRMAAQAALGAFTTVILIIDGYVQSSRTAAQNKVAAQARTVKLSQMKPFLRPALVEEATGYDFNVVYGYETSLGY